MEVEAAVQKNNKTRRVNEEDGQNNKKARMELTTTMMTSSEASQEEDLDWHSEEEEQCREDWFTRQMAEELNTREKLLVLLSYVRSSGRFNMVTESAAVLMHALYFGVYVGLLRFPGDFDASPMDRLEVLYEEWIELVSGRADWPIVDIELKPREVVWYEGWERKSKLVKPPYSEKSRPFGPREPDSTQLKRWQLEGIADMLPFGQEYMRAQAIAQRWSERDGEASSMSASQALELAAFVMQWIGAECYQTELLQKAPRGPVDPAAVQHAMDLVLRQPEDRAFRYALELVQARGRVWADLERRVACAAVPDVVPPRGGCWGVPVQADEHQTDKRYGLSRFGQFVSNGATREQQAELVRAVKRAMHVTIELDKVVRVSSYGLS
jgi:hypothetical protein